MSPGTGIDFAALLLMLVLGVLGLAMIGAVVWLIVRRPTGGDPNLMACGACGYSVRGVKTTSCPECGADLREVGIVRPQARGGAGWWVVLAVCIAFVFMVVICVGGVFYTRVAPMPTPPRPAPAPQPGAATIEEGEPLTPAQASDAAATEQ